MKTMLVLLAVVAMTGCASVVAEKAQPLATMTQPLAAPAVGVNEPVVDVPLKLMSPSQSAARVN
ncbi:hypothetical protein [Duganella caerulea]|uniref:hypothetical protein n=1 Tax=Duganella caerulea TaxID=2885762 RepID=UPI004037B3B1